MLKGSCLCGSIRFEVTGPLLGQASACHCGQCRKQSGHHWASGNVGEDGLNVTGTVSWYEASPAAKRGFCATCGSFLFWKAHDEDQVSFALGALDDEGGVALERHIFVADKPGYYTIADGLPQWEKS